MEDAHVGWIAAIIIGGFAGWLAEKLMESNMGVIMNIILGIVGAIVASWLLGALHIALPFNAWLNYLITGFIGACILIFVGRLIRR
ncbi:MULTISPECIES: GlsB/YeaQ/YmgE family stress response membrane protein [Rhizobium]|uniref:Putative membrane protein YeaQ/YmgE (Transglycosylase-associated protein family) n=1 Tax=Rhizobium paranaense TaxID=1650438 RepID=A0A7W9CZY8_9HYPH|nr:MULTISPECIES: GlsB/YeaQ/YmgE family stress response membrane protein [Rhizobium]MBB5572495.1 putative membrane protein YeaQ/YmgE (transglycosylase-associated protein family) [Rhizobium paranaense]PST63539.1 GlsB/YeaQ/YmgE family stress response membrane protein [Rhizobium sp. SEMIA4064]